MSDNKKQNGTFNEYEKKAEQLVNDHQKTEKVEREAEDKINKLKDKKGFDKLVDEVKTLIRLLNQWRKGNYENVSLRSIVLIVAALLYFISTADAVPDLLFGIGLLDDAAVMGMVAKHLKEELERFTHWEHKNK